MSQGFNTLSTSNVIKEDVARHNENYETLRSSFSGTSFPTGATAGQPCFRIDRGEDDGLGGVLGKQYTFCGNTSLGESGWLTEEEMNQYSAEIVNARGTKSTLDQRLDISMNEDGTLKSSVSAYQSEWILPSLTFTYLSTTSLKTSGNTTDIYLATRRVKINLSASVVYSEVISSTYDGGADETTVVIKDAVLDNTLVSIEHGIISPLADDGSLSYYTKAVIDAKPTGQKNLIINGRKTIQQRGTTGGTKQVTESSVNIGGSHTISFTGTATATIHEFPVELSDYTNTLLDASTNSLATRVESGTTVTTTAGYYISIEFSSTDFDNVQFEPGSVKTNFEVRHNESSLCKRTLQVFSDLRYYEYASSTYLNIPFIHEELIKTPLVESLTYSAVQGTESIIINANAKDGYITLSTGDATANTYGAYNISFILNSEIFNASETYKEDRWFI